MATKSSRSQFIEKLHTLLENPLDAASLRWVGEDAFEITCNDVRARHALSPSWEFRSLSSFIRQLSYYNFKRLSDRRRSSERRSAASGFIVFSHPSGLFIQGDATRLSGIVRKTRNRPEKTGGRRNSTSSITSALPNEEDELQMEDQRQHEHDQDQEHLRLQMMHQQHQHQSNSLPAWPLALHEPPRHLPNGNQEFAEDRRQLQNFSTMPAFGSSFPPVRSLQNEINPTWRPYNNAPVPSWDDQSSRPQLPRRSSDFGTNSLPPLSPKSKFTDPGSSRNPSLGQGQSDILNGHDHYNSPYLPPTFESNYSYPNSNEQDGPSPINSYHSQHDHSPHQSPPEVHPSHLLQHRNSLPNPPALPLHLQIDREHQLPPFIGGGMNHYHSHSHPNEVDLDLRLQQSTVPVRSFSQPQIHQLPPHYYDSPELSRAKLPSPPHWQSPESKSIPLLSTVSSNGMRAGPNVLPSLINLKEYGSYEEDRR